MGIWDDIGAGAFSAADEATFGLAGFIADLFGDDKADADRRKWQEAHKEATDIGGIVGTVGSLLLPGGIISKGVGKGIGLVGKGAKALKLGKTAEVLGKGAKAFDTVGDIIKGSKVIGEGVAGAGGKILRGAGGMLKGGLGAAEMAIPMAIKEKDFSGLPGSVGMGAVLSPILGKLGKMVGKAGGGLKSKLITDPILAGAGIPSSAIMKGAKYLGGDGLGGIKAAKFIKEGLAKELSKKGASTEAIMDLIEGNSGAFAKAKSILSEEGAGLYKRLTTEVISDPATMAFLKRGPEAQKALQEIMIDIRSRPQLGDSMQFLSKTAHNGGRATDRLSQLRGEAADLVKSKLDEFADIANPAVAAERAKYPFIKPLKDAALREEGAVKPFFTTGSSPTMEKGFIKNLLGGGAGAAVGGFDPNDPSSWGKAALSGVAGSLLGPMAMKALPKAANRLLGMGAGMAEKLGTKVPKLDSLGTSTAKLIGRLGPEILGTGEKAEGGAAVPGGDAKGTVASVAGAEAEVDATMDSPEEAEEAKAAAKEETNDKYSKVIEDKIRSLWITMGLEEAGIPLERFVADLGERTTGADGRPFDPKRSANILFQNKEEREAYLKDYELALQFQNIAKGGGLERALNYEGATSPMLAGVKDLIAGTGLGDADYLGRKQSFGNLVDFLANIETKDTTGQARAFTMKKVEDDIADIVRMKVPIEDKIALIQEKLQLSGMANLPKFKEWGLM